MSEHPQIFYGSRGVVTLEKLNAGDDVTLRFRAHEIRQLEQRRKMGIMMCLKEENLGLDFLGDALLVGAAAAFVRASKLNPKKKTKSLSVSLVNQWIDDAEDNGIEFEELINATVKAVVGGMPGGQKYLEAMDENLEGDDEGNVEAVASTAIIDVVPKKK